MPHAIAVMFCSATPAFTYWSGKRSMKSVRTPKPRSPLTSMTRSSCSARSLSARTKASRMLFRRNLNAELAHCSHIFVALRRAIMPQDLVLHERHSAAFHGVGDNAGGPVRAAGKRGAQSVMVVTVDPQRNPAERAPLRAERLEVDGVRDAPQRLELVVVDDRAEVAQAVVRREHRRLPRRALVAFAVAEHDEDALVAAQPSEVERHAGADAEAVAERAGR